MLEILRRTTQEARNQHNLGLVLINGDQSETGGHFPIMRPGATRACRLEM